MRIATLLACFLLTAFAADDSRCFPPEGRSSLKQSPAPLLKNPALPAGWVAEYKDHQLFLIRTASPDKAAFLLLDFKKTLKAPKYLPNMGGFYGEEQSRPAFVFAKGVFLAGVMGLTETKADPVARVFAARIPLQ